MVVGSTQEHLGQGGNKKAASRIKEKISKSNQLLPNEAKSWLYPYNWDHSIMQHRGIPVVGLGLCYTKAVRCWGRYGKWVGRRDFC